MEENTVLMGLYNYEKLLDFKYQVKELKKEIEELKKNESNLKKALLESSLDNYNIQNHNLNELTNLNSYTFGFKEKLSLLQFFTVDELIEFIKYKKEQYEKGTK